jgi:hypothetical protein
MGTEPRVTKSPGFAVAAPQAAAVSIEMSKGDISIARCHVCEAWFDEAGMVNAVGAGILADGWRTKAGKSSVARRSRS